MRKQVAQEHTWTPHHDTALSICVRRHEAVSLHTILFYDMR